MFRFSSLLRNRPVAWLVSSFLRKYGNVRLGPVKLRSKPWSVGFDLISQLK